MKGTRLELPNSELQKLNKLLEGKAKEINKEAQVGLHKAGMQILADAKYNLTRNKSIATGQLRDSGKVIIQGDSTIDVLFDVQHAANVELGQKSGTDVAPSVLVQWLKKKGFYAKGARGGRAKTGKKFTNSIWAVAKKISANIKAKGTKAKPFLFPAFRKNENDMMRIIKQAIDKVV